MGAAGNGQGVGMTMACSALHRGLRDSRFRGNAGLGVDDTLGMDDGRREEA